MRACFRYTCFVAYLITTLLLVAPVNSPAESELERIRKERVQERAHVYVMEGKRELEREHYIRAIRVLSDAIRVGGVPEAFKLRGKAQAGRGDPEAALRDYNSYLNTNSSDAQAHVLRGDVHLARRDFPKAIEDYNAAMRLDPTLVDAFRGRSAAYIGCGDYELAQKDLDVVLTRSPHDAEALTNMGTACHLAGIASAAEHFLRRALASETAESWREVILRQLDSLARHPDMASHIGVPSVPLPSVPEKNEQAPQTALQFPNADESASSGESFPRKDGTPESVAHASPTHTSILRGTSRIASKPNLNLSGRWSTTYMGSAIQLVVKHNDRRVTGILTIRDPVGKEDTYNFQGTFDGHHIVAAHHSGHSFRGILTAGGRLVGTVSTKHGKTLNVDFSR